MTAPTTAFRLPDEAVACPRAAGRRARLALPAVALLAAACTESPPPYPILDSGFAVTRNDIFWLDNERVLFTGYVGGRKPVGRAAYDRTPQGIFIWDTVKNEVTLYREGRYSGLCYADGKVRFVRIDDVSVAARDASPNIETIEGLLGEDAASPIRRISHKIESPAFRRSAGGAESRDVVVYESCGDVRHVSPGQTNRKLVGLKQEHGYLDFGEIRDDQDDAQDRVDLVSASSARIKTELPKNVLAVTELLFVDWIGQYFVIEHPRDNRQHWTDTNCYAAWFFDANGSTTKTCIPFGPYADDNGTLKILPVREGFVIGSSYVAPDGIRNSGLYFVSASVIDKLDAGLVASPALSKDGCTVAYTFGQDAAAGNVSSKAARTLRAIRICGSKEIKDDRYTGTTG